MAKVMKEHLAETKTEMQAAVSGLSKDQMKWRNRIYSIPGWLIILGILYFVGKNQIYP